MIKIAHFADTHIRNLKFHDEYSHKQKALLSRLIVHVCLYIYRCDAIWWGWGLFGRRQNERQRAHVQPLALLRDVLST